MSIIGKLQVYILILLGADGKVPSVEEVVGAEEVSEAVEVCGTEEVGEAVEEGGSEEVGGTDVFRKEL